MEKASGDNEMEKIERRKGCRKSKARYTVMTGAYKNLKNGFKINE